MSNVLDDCDSYEVTDFTGPNMTLDEEDVHPPQGLFIQDGEYVVPGSVRTRRGFTATAGLNGWAPNKLICTLFNWVQSQYNRILYFHSNSVVTSHDLQANTDQDIISGITALGASFVEVGYRAFMAFFKSDTLANLPTGASEARVWDGTFTSGAANVEKLFPRALVTQNPSATGNPYDFTAAFVDTTPGVMEYPGTHYFGFIGITKNGGLTPPGGHFSGTVFSYQTALAYAQGSTGTGLQITLTPHGTWPAWLTGLELIMTPVANPNAWYIVPGIIIAVPSGSSLSIPIAVNLTDTTLVSDSSRDVVQGGYFALISQDSSGNGPIKPHKIVAYSDRMVYLADAPSPDGLSTTTRIYISDQMKPQWVRGDQNILDPPEFRKLTSGVTQGATLFLMGPTWTYAYADNRRFPTSWPTPRTVSTTIGTPFVDGVAANDRGYTWVAAPSGLYVLSGAFYPELPANYHQMPDWKNINWNATPEVLKVKQDPNRRMVYVVAPYGLTQTTANVIMAWDYTAGVGPDDIRYCGMWHILNGAYNIGGIELVYSPVAKTQEIWIGRCPTPGRVMRQKWPPYDAALDNAALYNDDDVSGPVGIPFQYQIGPLARVFAEVYQWIATNFRLRGNGTISASVASLDGTNPQALLDMNPTAHPGLRYLRFYDKQSQACRVTITNNGAVNSWCTLSAMKTYFKRMMTIWQ